MTLNLDGLTGVLWAQLWQLTLLIPLAIWGVRLTCRRRSHLGYVILLAVLIKCVVPPLWSSPTGVFSWVSHAMGVGEPVPAVVESSAPRASAPELTPSTVPGPGASAGESGSVTPSPAQAEQSATSPSQSGPVPATPAPTTTVPGQQVAESIDWWKIGVAALLALWVCGIMGVVGYLLAKRIYLERFHDDTRVASKEELLSIVSECAIALDLRRRPDLVVTTHPTIPFVVGWWSPRLVMPKHIVDHSTTDDMRLIIAHELNHLRRWDTATNWIQLGVQALWWFHPLVWWLNAEIRRWRESCCDEEVVARLKCKPSRYAHCLLTVLDFQASLRATSGLDSLSPFEVTKQRLQNIMHPLGQFPRSTPLPVWLAFLVLTLIVLPGAAFTLPPQDVVAHDEIPTAPIMAGDPSIPPAPPIATSIPEPAGHLQGQPVPVAQAVAGRGPQWKYKFDVHRNYQYSVSIEADSLHGTVRHTGQPIVRATYVSGGYWALGIVNPQLAEWETPIPTRLFGSGFRPPQFPGPFDRGDEFTIDSQGHVTEEVGDSPLPLSLGHWSNWLFSPLPAPDRPADWMEEGTTTLSDTEEPEGEPFGYPGRSPFARSPEPTRLPAVTHDQWTQSTKEGVLTLIRKRTVTTQDRVDGEPRIELQTDSMWSFDGQLGLPVSLTGTGKLIRRQTNKSEKTPFQFTVRLLTLDEVQKAAQDAADAAKSSPPRDPMEGPGSISRIGGPVPPDQKLERGQKFAVEWHGTYFPGEVIELPETGEVKIHYSGWSEHSDEVVPRSRLRYPPPVVPAR